MCGIAGYLRCNSHDESDGLGFTDSSNPQFSSRSDCIGTSFMRKHDKNPIAAIPIIVCHNTVMLSAKATRTCVLRGSGMSLMCGTTS